MGEFYFCCYCSYTEEAWVGKNSYYKCNHATDYDSQVEMCKDLPGFVEDNLAKLYDGRELISGEDLDMICPINAKTSGWNQ